MYSTYRRWSTVQPWIEKGIVVGADQTQQWILPWWWHHYRQSNDYPVTFIDFGMSEEAQAWCKQRGHLLRLPVADIYVVGKEVIAAHRVQEWEHAYGREFWSQRNGWFKKPLACLLSPYTRSIWIDLDCEVRSSLKELFTFCDHPSGLALAPDIHDPLGGKRGYNSGVMVYKHGLPLLETWADKAFEWNDTYAGDQDILTHLIWDQKLSIAELPLIYNWSRCSGDNPAAKIVHWHGRHGKTVIASSPHLEFMD